MDWKTKIKYYFPNFNNLSAISYICASICMHQPNSTMLAFASSLKAKRSFIKDAIPTRLLQSLAYKLDPKARFIRKIAEEKFLRSLKKGDIAYIWPGASVDLFERVKNNKNIILKELINCHVATANKLLNEAYHYLNWPIAHRINNEMIKEENEQLSFADFVYAPSSLVKSSLIENGVSSDKILLSSYGTDFCNTVGIKKLPTESDALTFLFVGTIGVRKGVPLLFDYWIKANIKSKLILAGRYHDQKMLEYCAEYFKRPDIVYKGFTNDISGLYRSADVFVLPSFEEGSPLVTYDAMAHNLPVIVSPMGSGGIVQNGEDGIVIDPYDRDQWITAFQQLSQNAQLRDKLGTAAAKTAQNFIWEKVSQKRQNLLLDKINGKR